MRQADGYGGSVLLPADPSADLSKNRGGVCVFRKSFSVFGSAEADPYELLDAVSWAYADGGTKAFGFLSAKREESEKTDHMLYGAEYCCGVRSGTDQRYLCSQSGVSAADFEGNAVFHTVFKLNQLSSI